MKVAPSYISKSKLLKKIEKRAEERAQRIIIGENIDVLDKAIIESQKDNLARFADKNRCSIRFVKDADHGGNTVMKVYEDKHVLYRPYNPLDEFGTSSRLAIPYVENMYRGSAEIPSSRVLTTDKIFASQIKESARNVLNSKRGFDKKV